jgi:chloramphenicol 3-O-phosphotransferase
MNRIVYIFGPSCSGKSTLGQALQQQLGDQWTYLDRDQLIENGLCIESAADKTLEEKIQAVSNKVIIDAQIPWRAKKKEEVYCLLLPPLKTLLERDALRTEYLKRPERRAFYARQYVIDTHAALNAMDRKKFDIYFDSSLFSVEETVLKILQFLENKT